MTTGDGRTITYTAFDKPTRITKSATTVYAAGKAYEWIRDASGTKMKHYIGDFAVITKTAAGSGETVNYMHRDHLGSVDTITGHEMIDSVGLIHMNGRVYDPTLGRFLSADPNVQALDNLQNFNRYSYVLNNPLSYTDPTGFFFAKLFKAIGRALKKLLRSPIVRAIIQIVGCSFGPVACAAASGAMTAASGGSMADVFKAIAFSFIGDQVWGAVKGVIQDLDYIGKALVHGVVNGAPTVAQGGNFLVGFVSGALGKAVGLASTRIFGPAGNQAGLLGRTFMSAAAGCAGAVIAGGKCANGAFTAAFANLYNEGRHITHKIRRAIADNAVDKLGSMKWSKAAENGMFGKNKDKCNLFVYDQITDSGIPLETPNGSWYGRLLGREFPPTASQYGGADPDYLAPPGWVEVDEPQPGDIVAFTRKKSSGHVMLIGSPNWAAGTKGQTGVVGFRSLDFLSGVAQKEGSQLRFLRYDPHR